VLSHEKLFKRILQKNYKNNLQRNTNEFEKVLEIFTKRHTTRYCGGVIKMIKISENFR
jgi:hypothetical protein